MWGVIIVNLLDAAELLAWQLVLALVTWLASLVGAELPPPSPTARVWFEA